jgi:hypothetical protein
MLSARDAMQGTLAQRDAAATRAKQHEETAERLISETADIVELLTRIDSGAEVGRYAIGGLNRLIEQPEYMGGPEIESTFHHGARVTHTGRGLDLLLLACFCLQTDTNGVAYVQGLLMAGYEQVMGGDSRLLSVRTAPIGSVALGREIQAICQDARDLLPGIMQAFAQASS